MKYSSDLCIAWVKLHMHPFQNLTVCRESMKRKWLGTVLLTDLMSLDYSWYQEWNKPYYNSSFCHVIIIDHEILKIYLHFHYLYYVSTNQKKVLVQSTLLHKFWHTVLSRCSYNLKAQWDENLRENANFLEMGLIISNHKLYTFLKIMSPSAHLYKEIWQLYLTHRTLNMFYCLSNLLSLLINLSLIMTPKNMNKLFEINHVEKCSFIQKIISACLTSTQNLKVSAFIRDF